MGGLALRTRGPGGVRGPRPARAQSGRPDDRRPSAHSGTRILLGVRPRPRGRSGGVERTVDPGRRGQHRRLARHALPRPTGRRRRQQRRPQPRGRRRPTAQRGARRQPFDARGTGRAAHGPVVRRRIRGRDRGLHGPRRRGGRGARRGTAPVVLRRRRCDPERDGRPGQHRQPVHRVGHHGRHLHRRQRPRAAEVARLGQGIHVRPG